MEKRKAYYMRQGRFLFAMVATDAAAKIQSEFNLYEFQHITEARRFDAALADSDGWWVAG